MLTVPCTAVDKVIALYSLHSKKALKIFFLQFTRTVHYTSDLNELSEPNGSD
jgi:hypothetical protein